MRIYQPRKRPVFEELAIAGVSSLSFGFRLIYTNDLDKRAARDFAIEEIPGRNGAVTIDNGRYQNVTVQYILQTADGFAVNVPGFIDFLHSLRGFVRFEDSYHPGEYTIAQISSEIETATKMTNAGQIAFTVTRYPQRFLKRGELPLSISATPGQAFTVKNPTTQTALPVIRITPKNSATSTVLTWDGETIAVSGLSSQAVTIDSENKTIATASGNWFSKCTFSNGMKQRGYFPAFEAGETSVIFGSGADYEIIPHWWHL